MVFVACSMHESGGSELHCNQMRCCLHWCCAKQCHELLSIVQLYCFIVQYTQLTAVQATL